MQRVLTPRRAFGEASVNRKNAWAIEKLRAEEAATT
jgi:hypothetical protein